MPPASPAGDVGLPNLVEQRRLAVVDVAEHRHDRRARRQHLGLVLFLLDRDFFAGLFDDRVETEALGDLDRDVARDILIDRRHRSDLDELGDDVSDRHDHRRRQLLHGKQIGNLDRLERSRRRCGERTRPSSCDAAPSRAAALSRDLFLRSPCPRVSARDRRDGLRRMARADRWVARPAGPGPDVRPASSDGMGRFRSAVAAAQRSPVWPRAAELRLCRLDRASLHQAAVRRRAGPAGRFAGQATLRPRFATGAAPGGARPRAVRRARGEAEEWTRPAAGPRGSARGGRSASAATRSTGAAAAGGVAARDDAPVTGRSRVIGGGRSRRLRSGLRLRRGRGRRSRCAGFRLGGRLLARFEQHAAHEISDLIRHDAQLVFRLENAAEALVEERRQLFRGEPDLFGELEDSYFSGQVHSRARGRSSPISWSARSPNRRLGSAR